MTITNRKKFFFAFVVLLIALLPVVVLELILVASGWNQPSETRDPFIGFTGDQTLFEKDATGEYFQIKQSRLGYFCPAQFKVKKANNVFRVFVVGGSTVQGRPWETQTAFSKWLEIGLDVCEPSRLVEVINCGGVSYASYRLSFIFEEVLGYSPDLIILCTGHNEFLEQRTYRTEKSLPGPVIMAHRALSNLKSYQWLRSNVISARSNQSSNDVLGEKVITRLDYENGLELFQEKTLQRQVVRKHFRYNIEKMLSTAWAKDQHLVVLAPPSNQEWYPFKPNEQWKAGDASPLANMSREELGQSIKVVHPTAGHYYWKAINDLQMQKRQDAIAHFDKAIDTDICPLRMTSALRAELKDVVETAKKKFGSSGLSYIDLHQKCLEISPRKIVDEFLLVDHVHPSISTHKKIATWLIQQLQDDSVIARPLGWEDDFNTRADNHQQSLGYAYYQRGKDRLLSVLKWSRGQAIQPFKH